jgi:hypothetical protein
MKFFNQYSVNILLVPPIRRTNFNILFVIFYFYYKHSLLTIVILLRAYIRFVFKLFINKLTVKTFKFQTYFYFSLDFDSFTKLFLNILISLKLFSKILFFKTLVLIVYLIKSKSNVFETSKKFRKISLSSNSYQIIKLLFLCNGTVYKKVF